MTDPVAAPPVAAPPPAYAELQVASNYSFLIGASHPNELVIAAKALGLAALAIVAMKRNGTVQIVDPNNPAITNHLQLIATRKSQQQVALRPWIVTGQSSLQQLRGEVGLNGDRRGRAVATDR